MSQIEIDISFQSNKWLQAIEASLIKSINETLSNRDVLPPNELSLVLADNAFVQDLNGQYRNKDKPTNVLSFPQDEPGLLGDIILAFETIETEAMTQNKTFEDHANHLVVHGTLHLLAMTT